MKTVAIIGAVNESNIDSTRRVFDAIQACSDVQIFLFTSTPNSELLEYGILGRERVSIVREPDYEQYLDQIAASDIGILTHGFVGGMTDVEYQTIFPTRTLDFLMVGIPVLAHIPEKSFLFEFLNREKCAELVTEPSHQAIKVALHKLLGDTGKCQQLVKNGNRAMRHFEPDTIRHRFLSNIRFEPQHQLQV